MNQFEGKFLLPHFYAFIQWLGALVVLVEELISVLSVPLLSFGVVVSMIDFFQGGALSHDATFSYAWAIIQAVSLDAQVAFTWYKARRAREKGKTLALFGFLFIGIMLAFVVWASSSLEGQHQIANNSGPQEPLIITTVSHPEEWPYGYNPSIYAPPPNIPVFPTAPEVDNASVSLLGVSVPSNLLVSIRMGIAVVLLCIAGWTRKLITELDAEAPKEETQTETPKTDKKPFWLAQKWGNFRTRFTPKIKNQPTEDNTLVTQANEIIEEVCAQESVQEIETQSAQERNTGELIPVNTEDETKVFVDTDPELPTPMRTKRITQPLPELHTVSETKQPRQSATKSDTKNSRGDAYKRAQRIAKRNPNIKPGDLAKRAEISPTYARRILSELSA